MSVERWFVSTSHWTVRVDVRAGVIQPSSARFIQAAYGQAWATWRAWVTRQHGRRGVQIVRLEAA